MKNKLSALKVLCSDKAKFKRVMFSVVVLILLFVVSLSAVSAWVETISSILTTGDGEIDSPIYTNASVKSSSNSPIDLTAYFREAGNVHLSEASSADGVDFYFPVLDSTGETMYRKNNINDICVNYINFKLNVKSDADKSFVFNQEPDIKIGSEEISNSAVRMAIALQGESPKLFALSADTSTVVASESGTKAQTNVFKFADFVSSNEDNNTLFTLKANEVKELTVSLWLQEGIASELSGKEISIENISLVPDTPRHKVTATAVTGETEKDATGGTVQVGTGSAGAESSYNVEVGKTVTLKAVEKEGYLFTGWYDSATGGTLKSNSAEYTITVNNPCHYYARFEKACVVNLRTQYFNVDSNAIINDFSDCGTVKAGESAASHDSQDTVTIGSDIKIVATEQANYLFVGWYTESGELKYSSKEETFNVNEDVKLFARYVDAFTFKAFAETNGTASSSTGGTVKLNTNSAAATSTVKVQKNSTVTAVAVAKSGYVFLGWYDANGNQLADSTKTTYDFTATSTAAKNIYAKFVSVHTVNASAVYDGAVSSTAGNVKVGSAAAGKTSTVGNINYGSQITVIANVTDTSKYKFDGWYDSQSGGNKLSDSTSYTFTVDSNKDVYARFSDKGRAVYFQPYIGNDDWGSGTRYSCYVWDGSDVAWFDMTETSVKGVYVANVPSQYTNIIFCKMKNTGNSWGDVQKQTGDLTIPTTANSLYKNSSGKWITYSTVTLKFVDKTSDGWVNDANARIFLDDTSTGYWYEMTKISTNSSDQSTWSVTVLSDVTNVSFYRRNSDHTSTFNSWSAGSRGSKLTYSVTSSGSGSWS